MTHVTDARELLVKARIELVNALLNNGSDFYAVGGALCRVSDALDLLNLISQPGTSPQQTGDGANLSPAGDGSMYQHDDNSIAAARRLIAALEADSPLGNEADAQMWAREQAPDAARIAAQRTEAECARDVIPGLVPAGDKE